MDWSNSAQNYPYQYNPQQENAALTAIGSGLRIDAAINDDVFDELEVMTGGPLPGDNVPPSDFVTSDTFLPPLIIEPFGVSDTGSMMQAQYYGQPDSISSSCSSHASGSMDGNSVGGWPESPVRYSAQTSQAGRSDSMFGAHLPHSPYTTPQNSPCTTRDDEIRDNDEFRFRTPLDSLHGFTVSNFEFSPGLSPFGRNTTPDHVDTGMAIDWTQQSVGQYHQNPCPSVSAPSTPHMGPMISASQLQQQFQAMPIPDSESSSSSSSLSSSSLPRNPGSHLLAVPPSDKFRAPRRYSDPPQPSFQPSSPSWSPAATGFGRDRPRSPNYSTTQGSARPPGVKKASVYKALPAAAPKSSVIARRKGVRTSCLPEETKVQARKTRNERTMCLSCRLSKVKCIGASERCIRCATKSFDKGPRVCSKAYFLHHIKAQSTSFLLHYQIYPQRSDYSRRMVPLPSGFNLRSFSAKVRDLGKASNLTVYQSGAYFATFDLTACEAYISSLLETSSQSTTFSEFINEKLPQTSKNKGWVACVKQHPALDGSLSTWVRWDKLPTHMDYALVSKADNTHRRLNPDNAQDLETMQLAARIFAIVSRALELAAYAKLETQLKRDEMVGPDFLQSLGQLLLLLRWRVAWWRRLGTQIPCIDRGILAQRDTSVGSVRQLCTCLYMYYCFYRRSRLRMEQLHGYDLGGQISQYPNAMRHVAERFPGEESFVAFEEWMEEGNVIFQECGSLHELMYY